MDVKLQDKKKTMTTILTLDHHDDHEQQPQQRTTTTTTTCPVIVVSIQGMTCSSCVASLESNIKKRVKGVSAVSVSLATQRGRIFLEEEGATDPSSVLGVIQDLGFEAEVLQLKEEEEGEEERRVELLSHRKSLQKWRRVFLFNCCFSIPSMILMMYFMYWGEGMTTHTMDSWLLDLPGLDLPNTVMLILATPVLLIGSRDFVSSAISSLLYARVANMDVLVVLAAGISYLYSIGVMVFAVATAGKHGAAHTFLESPPMLVTFVSLGRFLESIAAGKTTEALTSLMKLASKEAVLLTPDRDLEESGNYHAMRESVVDVKTIVRDDVIKVRPGSRVPVDGVVLQGDSAVDESLITGESLPVVKSVGDRVIGGSFNQNGLLVVKATTLGRESTLGQIVRLVQEAQESKAPIQAFADSVAGVFVPAIVFLSTTTLLVWLVIGFWDPRSFSRMTGLDPSTSSVWSFALKTSLTVLSIACPCSLGLATPTAVMVGTGVGAVNGILVKAASSLEVLASASVVLFDKTGTITVGTPRVNGVFLVGGGGRESLMHLLRMTRSVESLSEHPIASCITAFVDSLGVGDDGGVKVDKFTAVPGLGLSCRVSMAPAAGAATGDNHLTLETRDGHVIHVKEIAGGEDMEDLDDRKDHSVLIGSQSWLECRNHVLFDDRVKALLASSLNDSLSVIGVAVDSRLRLLISASDSVKEEARVVVSALKARSIPSALLTGDSAPSASWVAHQTAIPHVFSSCLPADKVSIIKALQAKGLRVVVVGDGVNDSPGLARADVGIAVAASSSSSSVDVAVEAADVLLMNNDLRDVVHAIDLSERTVSRIRINFAFACLYNLVGVPVAAGVFLPFLYLEPWMGSAAMVSSSLSVMMSSLLLRLWKKQQLVDKEEEEEEEVQVLIGDNSDSRQFVLHDLISRITKSSKSSSLLLSSSSSSSSVNHVKKEVDVEMAPLVVV